MDWLVLADEQKHIHQFSMDTGSHLEDFPRAIAEREREREREKERERWGESKESVVLIRSDDYTGLNFVFILQDPTTFFL